MSREDKTILDWFEDEKEFGALLATAEQEASTSFEIEFVADMQQKFNSYGIRAWMSEKQANMLMKIADKVVR